MTMTHPSDEQLQDLADGVAAASELRILGDHLVACADCRSALASIERSKEAARRLAVDMPPPEGEWEAIEDRIAGPGAWRAARAQSRVGAADGISSGRVTFTPHSVTLHPGGADVTPGPGDTGIPGWPIGLRWAAIFVVAIGLSWGLLSLPTWMETRGGDAASNASPAAPGTFAGEAVARPAALVEGAYAPSIIELQRVLADTRDQLDPETVRIVDENLAVIAEAIARVHEALDSDPASAPALRSLDSLLNTQLRVLRLAAELPRET